MFSRAKSDISEASLLAETVILALFRPCSVSSPEPCLFSVHARERGMDRSHWPIGDRGQKPKRVRRNSAGLGWTQKKSQSGGRSNRLFSKIRGKIRARDRQNSEPHGAAHRWRGL